MEDANHPWGDNVDITITSVTVANAEDETSEETVCEQNSDNTDEYYNLHTLSTGHAVATVTYIDVSEAAVEDSFDIYVSGDVYSLDISSSTEKDHLLPGASLDLTASVWHDVYYYDEDSEEYVYNGFEAEDISFEWSLADENDREYLIIEQDEDDAAVLHVTAADNLEEDYDVQVYVSVCDINGDEIASGDYWIYIRHGYYQLVLNDVNTDLEVGETMTIVPELRFYNLDADSEDGYDVIEDAQYRWDWDENAVRITDAGGEELYYDDDSNEHTYGTADFALTKLENWGTDLTLHVETPNDNGDYEEVTEYGFYLNGLDYGIGYSWAGNDEENCRFNEDGNTWGYTDETLALTYESYISDELDAYEIQVDVGAWEETDETDEEGNTIYNWNSYRLDSESGVSVDSQSSTISLDMTAIAEAATGASVEDEDFEYDGFNVRVVVVPTAEEFSDYELNAADIWVEYHIPYYDYQVPYGDWSALPDWDYWINKTFNCYVEDAEHPWGEDIEITISDVTVANAEDETSDESICEENSDNHEDGYNLHTLAMGNAVALVTYTDVNGDEANDTFDIYVGGDVYSLDISSSTGTDQILPGAGLDLTASVWHDVYHYDEDSEEYVYEGYEEEISCVWSLADAESYGDILTITSDENDSAVLHVATANDLEDDYDVQICLTVYDSNEDEIASGDYWIYIRHGYYQLVLTEDVDTDIEVGETTAVVPELRLYSSDTDSEDSYDVIEDVQYRWDWDENAVRITDAESNILSYEEDEDGNNCTYGSANFTLTKLENWGTDLTLHVETPNDNGDYEEVTEYGFCLNELGYGIWYEDVADQGRFDEWGNTWGYTDENLTLTYETDISEDYDSYEIQVDVGEWVETSETDENGDIIYEWTSYGLNSESGVSCEDSTITLDITAIAEAATKAKVTDEDFSYDGFNVRVAVVPTAEEFSDYELNVAEIWIGYCEPYYDYQLPYGDWSALPDWDYWINKTFNCYVEDADHPWGEDIEITISDVTVANAKDEESEEIICEENSDNHEDGYNLHTLSMGHAVATVTYNDVNEDQVTDTFDIYVGGDVYSLDISSSTEKDHLLPGASLDLTASVWHDVYYYDEDSDEYVYDGYEEEISCVWSLADEDSYEDILTITQDTEDSAVLHVTAADNLEGDYDVQICLTVNDNDENEIASGDYWIYIRNNYYQLVLTEEINTDLEVGETTTVVPELRLYSSDTDSEDSYDVIEDVQYRWDWDENAVRITDAESNILSYEEDEDGNNCTYGSANFTLTKLENWGTDLTLHVETP
ncbi:MAG: hypothetical protein LUI13_11610, partial [Lachnospiraceae bacterium]|nr:hypothetical protein [Lachnospiraceae bacterium]